MNIKNKKFIFNAFLLLFALSFFSIAGKVSADTCSTQNTGFACVDTTKVNGAAGCKTGLCPGSNDVKCCGLAPVTCKTSGSSGQPCSANGNYGICNAIGVCVDSSAGQIPTTSSTIPSTPSGGGTTFVNPLTYNNVEGLLGGIMGAIQKIIVVLALVFIMIGAVMILVSAGNSKMVENGKSAITMALVGLALGIAAPSILKELANILGWGGTVPVALTLSEIAIKVLNFLLGTMGVLALVMLVIGGITYLTSAGDEGRAEKGKQIFTYSLIGIFLAMAAMILVTQVAKFFV
ncbi:MAG: pilin [bacterium]